MLMNKLLLTNLARYYRNPSPMVREELGKEIAASFPPEVIMRFIADYEVIQGIIRLACELVIDANSKDMRTDGWDRLLQGAYMNEGVVRLRSNPATLALVQAALIISMAAVLAGQEDEPQEAEGDGSLTQSEESPK